MRVKTHIIPSSEVRRKSRGESLRKVATAFLKKDFEQLRSESPRGGAPTGITEKQCLYTDPN